MTAKLAIVTESGVEIDMPLNKLNLAGPPDMDPFEIAEREARRLVDWELGAKSCCPGVRPARAFDRALRNYLRSVSVTPFVSRASGRPSRVARLTFARVADVGRERLGLAMCSAACGHRG